MSGRIAAVDAFAPDPRIVWVGAASGGVWKSTNGGLTFEPVFDGQPVHAIGALAIDPRTPDVVWVGTGEGNLRNSISHGDGAYLTRDGGATWASVEKALPAGVPKNAHVIAIEASRHDAATAFAVLDNHRWGDFTPYVYRTDDLGKTWRSLVTPAVKGYALTLVQDPVKKDLLFLGTETGLYAFLDGGKGWLHLSRTIPTASVMDLAIHPKEGDLVFATHGRAISILDDLTPLRELTEEALGRPLTLFTPPSAWQYWQAAQDGTGGAGAADFAGASRPYGAILTFSLNVPGLPPAGEEEPPAAAGAGAGRARRERTPRGRGSRSG